MNVTRQVGVCCRSASNSQVSHSNAQRDDDLLTLDFSSRCHAGSRASKANNALASSRACQPANNAGPLGLQADPWRSCGFSTSLASLVKARLDRARAQCEPRAPSCTLDEDYMHPGSPQEGASARVQDGRELEIAHSTWPRDKPKWVQSRRLRFGAFESEPAS